MTEIYGQGTRHANASNMINVHGCEKVSFPIKLRYSLQEFYSLVCPRCTRKRADARRSRNLLLYFHVSCTNERFPDFMFGNQMMCAVIEKVCLLRILMTSVEVAKLRKANKRRWTNVLPLPLILTYHFVMLQAQKITNISTTILNTFDRLNFTA